VTSTETSRKILSLLSDARKKLNIESASGAAPVRSNFCHSDTKLIKNLLIDATRSTIKLLMTSGAISARTEGSLWKTISFICSRAYSFEAVFGADFASLIKSMARSRKDGIFEVKIALGMPKLFLRPNANCEVYAQNNAKSEVALIGESTQTQRTGTIR
jgi:hypothetical protein